MCEQVCAVCTGVHGCVWKSAEMCGCLPVSVLDEFSEYLLETRVNTSADFNTYPISLLFSEHTLKLVKVKLQVFSCTPICKSKSQTSSCLSLIKDVLYT